MYKKRALTSLESKEKEFFKDLRYEKKDLRYEDHFIIFHET